MKANIKYYIFIKENMIGDPMSLQIITQNKFEMIFIHYNGLT